MDTNYWNVDKKIRQRPPPFLLSKWSRFREETRRSHVRISRTALACEGRISRGARDPVFWLLFFFYFVFAVSNYKIKLLTFRQNSRKISPNPGPIRSLTRRNLAAAPRYDATRTQQHNEKRREKNQKIKLSKKKLKPRKRTVIFLKLKKKNSSNGRENRNDRARGLRNTKFWFFCFKRNEKNFFLNYRMKKIQRWPASRDKRRTRTDATTTQCTTRRDWTDENASPWSDVPVVSLARRYCGTRNRGIKNQCCHRVRRRSVTCRTPVFLLLLELCSIIP